MKVKLLLGPICCGKTTYANHLQKNDGYIKFSQDDLRNMLYGNLEDSEETNRYLTNIIYSGILQLMPERGGKKKVVVDGFPLMADCIEYLVSHFDTDLLMFDVDLKTANDRNIKRRKETGIYIHPKEIKEYNESYNRFIKTEDFQRIAKRCNILNMSKLEK